MALLEAVDQRKDVDVTEALHEEELDGDLEALDLVEYAPVVGQELLASGDVGQVVADEDQVVAPLPWEDMLPVALLLEQHYGAMAQCSGDLVALPMNERSLLLSSPIPQILVCVERRHPVDHLEAARETMNYLAFAAMNQLH